MGADLFYQGLEDAGNLSLRLLYQIVNLLLPSCNLDLCQFL